MERGINGRKDKWDGRINGRVDGGINGWVVG